MGEARRPVMILRYLDLLLLAAALPVFLAAGLPMLGYWVLAGIWLAQLAIEVLAERSAERALAGGNRRGAMGRIAAATLGRVWLITLAVLLVGLSEREAGLAAALLAVVLFTVHFAARFVVRAIEPGEKA